MGTQTIAWKDGAAIILDQTELPEREVFLSLRTVPEMAEAISSLRVRGAPLIGVSAAFGMALSARNNQNATDFLGATEADAECLRATRPTAVNLFYALDRAAKEIRNGFRMGGPASAAAAALALAQRMKEEDIEINRALGRNGASLFQDGDGVLTHCNAGALATAGFGTALGVLRAAVAAGKRLHVFADETRPLLQGARLTCWELQKDLIPVTLLTDSMAGTLMARGLVQKVIVGADRIAKNGDTANKVGTYSVAVLAAAHGIPFYVAAPEASIDRSLQKGDQIPIEFRAPSEVRAFRGAICAPPNVEVFNPAFDVTPSRYISGIITERKVYKPDNWGNFSL